MTIEALILSTVAIILGIVTSALIMHVILRAMHPKWLLAQGMCRALKVELGIWATVHSIEDATRIIRLTVHNAGAFPVAERLEEIKDVLTLDVRLETDGEQRPVLVVLPPNSGLRKPSPRATQPLVRQMTTG